MSKKTDNTDTSDDHIRDGDTDDLETNELGILRSRTRQDDVVHYTLEQIAPVVREFDGAMGSANSQHAARLIIQARAERDRYQATLGRILDENGERILRLEAERDAAHESRRKVVVSAQKLLLERDSAKTALETARIDRENTRQDCDAALAQLEQRTAERDLRETARVLAVQERDAALVRTEAYECLQKSSQKSLDEAWARVKELEAERPIWPETEWMRVQKANQATIVEQQQRIAALEADVERWQSKAGAEHDRVKELENALEVLELAAEAENMEQRIAALEAENAELRGKQHTCSPDMVCVKREAYAAYGRWLDGRSAVEGEAYATTRIAENERLRVAFDEYPGKLRQEYCLDDDEDFPDGQSTPTALLVIEELHAALKGEGDE